MSKLGKYIQVNKDGLMEEIDLDTGEIVILEKDLSDAIIEAPEKQHTIIRDSSNQLVLAPQNATAEQLRNISGNQRLKPYSAITALDICERVANGEILTQICSSPDMPTFAQLCRWRRLHPEFNEWLKVARKDRGEVFFDKAIRATEEAAEDRDSISLAKLKADVYKTAARMSNPADFADKPSSSQQVNVAVGATFILETGIRRAGDDGFNEDEALKLIKEIEGGN